MTPEQQDTRMCDQHTEKNTLNTPCVEARRGGFVARIWGEGGCGV